MFTPSRFVVIDDKLKHLEAIVKSLRAGGTPCHPILYNPEEDPDPVLFKGVRGLFMDLQLNSDLVTSDFAAHFSVIQTLLELCIHPDSGPFVMILWTDRPEQASELAAYLGQNIEMSKRYCVPLRVIALPKNRFINLSGDEDISPESQKQLEAAILEKISEVPAMASIMEWETEISRAAGLVLSDIVAVSKAGSTGSVGDKDATAVSLAETLRHLAYAFAGAANFENDIRSNLHGVLMPMLNDRLYNLPLDLRAEAVWADSWSDAPQQPTALPAKDVASLHSIIHLEIPATGTDDATPTAWGAVSDLPASFEWSSIGYLNQEDFISTSLTSKINGNNLPMQLAQVRVGASCDYAQQTTGPIQYAILGILPAKEDGRPRNLKPQSPLWLSPILHLDGGVVQLAVNPRAVYTTSHNVAGGFQYKFRIREQMLMELVSRISYHASRPGIVRFEC